MWAKMSNFETGVHTPLIIAAPWLTASMGKLEKQRTVDTLARRLEMRPSVDDLKSRGIVPPPTMGNGMCSKMSATV